jgi:hypothetical protein
MKNEIEETMRRVRKADPRHASEMAYGVVVALRSLTFKEPRKKKRVKLKKT